MNKGNPEYISDFWNLYKTLLPAEADAFSQFVDSGLFNRKKPVVHLLKICKKQFAEKGSAKKEQLYAEAFDGKKYNGQVLKNYFTHLKKLLLQFMQLQWMQQKISVQQWAVAEMYLQKGLVNQFQKLSKKYVEDKKPVYSPDEIFIQLKLQSLSDEYLSTTATKRRFDLLEACVFNFREYYFLDTMRMYCELINRRNLKGIEFNKKELQSFLQYFHENKSEYNLHPLLQIYFYVFGFLKNSDDEEAYMQYKKILIEYVGQMPVRTARELCLYGQNQCVKHINLNHHKYLSELFDLYNIMLLNNIMYEGQYMSQWTFKNYITVALRLKEFYKAENFIETYKHKILPDVQHDAYHYNLASLYFEKNDFDAAMVALNKIHSNDAVYYLDGRSILLKIYFEKEDFETLASLYHSVRVYLLRNKKLSRKQGDLYRYLFLYTYRLSRLIDKRPFIDTENYAVAKNKLHEKILNTDIANKNWLTGKLNVP
ncbi:MAG: hypothetical protein H7Y00_12310 [Fimbriimonadaceae bacterium]|nr:hypothetical protein [Chitinophagales bacterium]